MDTGFGNCSSRPVIGLSHAACHIIECAVRPANVMAPG